MKRADSASVSVRVDGSAELAFKVFTDDVDLWWKRGIAYRVAGKKPSTMRFEGELGGRLVARHGLEQQFGQLAPGVLDVFDAGVDRRVRVVEHVGRLLGKHLNVDAGRQA